MAEETRTITTCHREITKACRELHGDEGAWEQALRDVRGGFNTLLEAWGDEPRAVIHLKIEIEYPFEN